jgi:hypothetical protein
MGLFRKTVNDQDWLLSVLPLYESARPIMVAFSEAFVGGCREDLNGAVGKVLHELPSLADQLSRLPNPRSRAARIARQNLRRSLNAYVSGARELDSLFELSARGLQQVVVSRGRTAELFYSAHLNAIQAIASNAARLLTEANDSFSGVVQKAAPEAEPQQ